MPSSPINNSSSCLASPVCPASPTFGINHQASPKLARCRLLNYLSEELVNTQVICLPFLSLLRVSPSAWHYGHGLQQCWIPGTHYEQVWVSWWIFMSLLPCKIITSSDWAFWSPPTRHAVFEHQNQLGEDASDPSYFSHFKGIARGRINTYYPYSGIWIIVGHIFDHFSQTDPVRLATTSRQRGTCKYQPFHAGPTTNEVQDKVPFFVNTLFCLHGTSFN